MLLGPLLHDAHNVLHLGIGGVPKHCHDLSQTFLRLMARYNELEHPDAGAALALRCQRVISGDCKEALLDILYSALGEGHGESDTSKKGADLPVLRVGVQTLQHVKSFGRIVELSHLPCQGMRGVGVSA